MSSSPSETVLLAIAGLLSAAVLIRSIENRPSHVAPAGAAPPVASPPAIAGPATAPTMVARKLEEPLLPNLHQLTSDLYCGGIPQGEAGLKRLADLGIKTILSVDGERPQVELARKQGLRYVHLPIGYDQVPRKDLVAILAAAQRCPAPIYVHCHRGLHRSPAAAVALWRLQNPAIDGETAERLIRQIGTAPRYAGLYASVRMVSPLTRDESEALSKIELVEVAEVGTLVEQMVEVEATWERLKPLLADADSPPADEARSRLVHLAEQLTEAGRLRRQQSDDELARELELAGAKLLDPRFETPAGQPSGPQLRAKIQAQCDDCHARFRDHVSRP